MVSAPPPPVASGLLRGYSSGSSPLVSSPSSAGSVSGVGPFPARYGVGVSEISGRESGGSGFDPTWLLRRARRVRRFFRSHMVRRSLQQDSIRGFGNSTLTFGPLFLAAGRRRASAPCGSVTPIGRGAALREACHRGACHRDAWQGSCHGGTPGATGRSTRPRGGGGTTRRFSQEPPLSEP